MCLQLCSLSSECYKFLLGNVRTSVQRDLLGLHILLVLLFYLLFINMLGSLDCIVSSCRRITK